MHPPLARRDRRLIAAGTGVGVLGLALATWAVIVTTAVPHFDTTVSQRMHDYGWESPRLTEVVRAVTRLGNFEMLTALTVIGAAAALWQRNWRLAVVWVVVMAGQGLTVAGIKLLVARDRAVYENPLATEDTYSFPSGH